MVFLTALRLTESDRNFMAPAGNMLSAFSKSGEVIGGMGGGRAV
jgi:hypothetical protein